MKRISFFIVCLFITTTTALLAQEGKTCNPEKEEAARKKAPKAINNTYGEAFKKEGAVPTVQLNEIMKDKAEATLTITGTVNAVCQVKGCWMTTDIGNNKSMRIRFKDYGFFMPKDCSGQTFYAHGVASWDTTSVAMLKHYAEDAGKSQAEIDAIKEPKVELVFLASGVVLQPKKEK